MAKEILVRNRSTGAMEVRRDEPVKLRVCRGCLRVHDTPSMCVPAA